MITTLILGLVLQSPMAADFFPLKPGPVFTFEEKGGTAQIERVVGSPLDMGGVPVYAVADKQAGRQVASTYYRVDSDQVSVIAYDIKHPLTPPMILFKVGPKSSSWDYSGRTMVGPDGERLLTHGESKSLGMRDVLGKKVEAIEVKMIARKGVGISALSYDQTAIYAKGFGLVEWTDKITLGRSKKPNVVSYHLISMEASKG